MIGYRLGEDHVTTDAPEEARVTPAPRGILATIRHYVVMGLVLFALFILNGTITGCETDDDMKAYYGPPPADDTSDYDVDEGDVPSTVEDIMVAYYGPQQVDTIDDDTALDTIDPMEMVTYYGPQPVDVVDDDTALDTVDPVDMVTYYGPQPFPDTVDDGVTPDIPQSDIVAYYGPQVWDVTPVDDGATDDAMPCDPVAVYGPQPCTSDDDCASYGEGWYCNEDNSYDDGCGGTISWPTCEPPVE